MPLTSLCSAGRRTGDSSSTGIAARNIRLCGTYRVRENGAAPFICSAYKSTLDESVVSMYKTDVICGRRPWSGVQDWYYRAQATQPECLVVNQQSLAKARGASVYFGKHS